MGKRLISIDYCSAPRPAFLLTFTWHQPEHLDVFQVMRVTALSSVNTEIPRHLQKAICTSRQVKRLAFLWQVSPWRQPGPCLELINHTKTQPACSSYSEKPLPVTMCLRRGNKQSWWHQLLIPPLQSCEGHESSYEGAVQWDTCPALLFQIQRAVKPQLWALPSAPVQLLHQSITHCSHQGQDCQLVMAHPER